MTEPNGSYDNDVSISDTEIAGSTADAADGDLPDFELATDEGNLQVDLLVRRIAALVRAGEVERREAVEALSDGLRGIAASNPDATDVTVRDAIVRELQPAFRAAGWQVPEPFEF